MREIIKRRTRTLEVSEDGSGYVLTEENGDTTFIPKVLLWVSEADNRDEELIAVRRRMGLCP